MAKWTKRLRAEAELKSGILLDVEDDTVRLISDGYYKVDSMRELRDALTYAIDMIESNSTEIEESKDLNPADYNTVEKLDSLPLGTLITATDSLNIVNYVWVKTVEDVWHRRNTNSIYVSTSSLQHILNNYTITSITLP